MRWYSSICATYTLCCDKLFETTFYSLSVKTHASLSNKQKISSCFNQQRPITLIRIGAQNCGPPISYGPLAQSASFWSTNYRYLDNIV